MRDWSELGEGPLLEISRRIVDYKDFSSFGWVCRSWKSVASMDDNFSDRQTAFLLLLCQRDTDCRRVLYDLTSRQRCDDDILLRHKSFHRYGGVFASQGWLVVVSQTDLKPLLLNPLDGTSIRLPHLRCNRCYGKIRSFHLQKAAISSDPSLTSDYIVALMAVVSTDTGRQEVKSFLWQAGGGHDGGSHNHPGCWSIFSSSRSNKLVCFRGLLVTLHFDDSIRVQGPPNTKLQLLPVAKFPYKLPRRREWWERKYLVESQRGLLVIVQFVDNSSVETKEFHVFELDWASKEWTQVQDLGYNRALFLKPFQLPTLLICNRFLANRIYSLSKLKVMKLEIYNLATKSFEPPFQFPLCHRGCLQQAHWLFQTRIIKPDS